MEIPVHDIVNTGGGDVQSWKWRHRTYQPQLDEVRMKENNSLKTLLAGNLPASLGDFAFRVEKTGVSHSNC